FALCLRPSSCINTLITFIQITSGIQVHLSYYLLYTNDQWSDTHLINDHYKLRKFHIIHAYGLAGLANFHKTNWAASFIFHHTLISRG
uniref:Uncharacterized protein n=1 Tax=Oryza brachyantha TaxID=4533 RepID=J3MD52_ORYBR